MDLFGMKEHDARHDEGERQLRRLIEQVAELSIDLGVVRTDMRRLSLVVEGKVDEAAVDESVVALNEGVKQARAKLVAAQEAAEENWTTVNDELAVAVESLRDAIEDAQ